MTFQHFFRKKNKCPLLCDAVFCRDLLLISLCIISHPYSYASVSSHQILHNTPLHWIGSTGSETLESLDMTALLCSVDMPRSLGTPP